MAKKQAKAATPKMPMTPKKMPAASKLAMPKAMPKGKRV